VAGAVPAVPRVGSGVGASASDIDYTYYANGNRSSKTLGGVTEDYVNDAGDKLTQIKIGTTVVKSFGYDAAGRTTGITSSKVSPEKLMTSCFFASLSEDAQEHLNPLSTTNPYSPPPHFLFHSSRSKSA
jgi:YD repeat-containing protein